jgi:hypothetical protein
MISIINKISLSNTEQLLIMVEGNTHLIVKVLDN